jgi:hypothetical protein
MRLASTIIALNPRQLRAQLLGWQRAARYILDKGNFPPLYESGVRYRQESRGQEFWKLPDQVLSDGYGDCEDLAAWRSAELELAGEQAEIVLVRAKPTLWHVAVKRGNGRIEDPSRRLGMRGPA